MLAASSREHIAIDVAGRGQRVNVDAAVFQHTAFAFMAHTQAGAQTGDFAEAVLHQPTQSHARHVQCGLSIDRGVDLRVLAFCINPGCAHIAIPLAVRQATRKFKTPVMCLAVNLPRADVTICIAGIGRLWPSDVKDCGLPA